MKLSLKTEYAFRVLAQLGRTYGSEELAHIDALAKAETIPANYLVQILNELRHAGIIQSRRGKQGGYVLVKQPVEVTLHDIIKAVEGDLLDNPPKVAGQSGERVAEVWGQVAAEIAELLKDRTLQDLLPQETEGMYYI
ncbi:MAG: RrF2 family transcriptional regulator [Opitutales bacterium]